MAALFIQKYTRAQLGDVIQYISRCRDDYLTRCFRHDRLGRDPVEDVGHTVEMVSQLAGDRLGILPEELEEVAVERNVKLPPPQQVEDGGFLQLGGKRGF